MGFGKLRNRLGAIPELKFSFTVDERPTSWVPRLRPPWSRRWILTSPSTPLSISGEA